MILSVAILQILTDLWNGSVGSVFWITIGGTIAVGLIYTSYFSRFYGGIGSLYLGWSGLGLFDFLALIPLAVLTTVSMSIQTLPRLTVSLVKFILGYFILPFAVGIIMAVVLQSTSGVAIGQWPFLSEPLVVIAYIFWLMASYSGLRDPFSPPTKQSFISSNLPLVFTWLGWFALVLPVIKIAQMRKNSTEGADKASPLIESAYIVNDGDVLFSWSGSLEAMVWCGGKGALNQHLFKVSSVDYPKWFYFHWTKYHLPDFQSIAAGKATTMGHIQRHHLRQALTVVPSPEVMQAADRIMSPLLSRYVANQIESRTLTALRDALLPKLMSGEVRVGAAEEKVGQ